MSDQNSQFHTKVPLSVVLNQYAYFTFLVSIVILALGILYYRFSISTYVPTGSETVIPVEKTK